MADGLRRFAAGLLGGQQAVDKFDHRVGVRDSNLPSHYGDLNPAFGASLLDLRHKQAQAKTAARRETRTQQAHQNLGYDPNFHLTSEAAQKGFIARQAGQQRVENLQRALPDFGLPKSGAYLPSDAFGPATQYLDARQSHDEGIQNDFRQQGFDAYKADRELDPLRAESRPYGQQVSNYAVAQGVERGEKFLDRWRENSAAEETTKQYLYQMGAISPNGTPDALAALQALQQLSVVDGQAPPGLEQVAEYVKTFASQRGFSVAQATEDLLGRIDNYYQHQQERQRVEGFSQFQGGEGGGGEGGGFEAPTDAPPGGFGGEGGPQARAAQGRGLGAGSEPFSFGDTLSEIDRTLSLLPTAPQEHKRAGAAGLEFSGTIAKEAQGSFWDNILQIPGVLGRSRITRGAGADNDEFSVADIGSSPNTRAVGDAPTEAPKDLPYQPNDYKLELGRPNPLRAIKLDGRGKRVNIAEDKYAAAVAADKGKFAGLRGFAGRLPGDIVSQAGITPLSHSQVNDQREQAGLPPLTPEASKWLSIALGVGSATAIFAPGAGSQIQKQLGKRALALAAKGQGTRLTGRAATATGQGIANAAGGAAAAAPVGGVYGGATDESGGVLKGAALAGVAGFGVGGIAGAGGGLAFKGRVQKNLDNNLNFKKRLADYYKESGYEDPLGIAYGEGEKAGGSLTAQERTRLEEIFNDPARQKTDDAAVADADATRKQDPVEQELADIREKVRKRVAMERLNKYLRAQGLPPLEEVGDAPTAPPRRPPDGPDDSEGGGGAPSSAEPPPPRDAKDFGNHLNTLWGRFQALHAKESAVSEGGRQEQNVALSQALDDFITYGSRHKANFDRAESRPDNLTQEYWDGLFDSIPDKPQEAAYPRQGSANAPTAPPRTTPLSSRVPPSPRPDPTSPSQATAPTPPPTGPTPRNPRIKVLDRSIESVNDDIHHTSRIRDSRPEGSEERGAAQQQLNELYAKHSRLSKERAALVPEGESPTGAGGAGTPPRIEGPPPIGGLLSAPKPPLVGGRSPLGPFSDNTSAVPVGSEPTALPPRSGPSAPPRAEPRAPRAEPTAPPSREANPRIAELDTRIAAAEKELADANAKAETDADSIPYRDKLATLKRLRSRLANDDADAALEAEFYSEPYAPTPENQRPPASIGIPELNAQIQPIKDRLREYRDTLGGRKPDAEELAHINGLKKQIKPLIDYRRQLEEEQGSGGGRGGGDGPTAAPPRAPEAPPKASPQPPPRAPRAPPRGGTRLPPRAPRGQKPSPPPPPRPPLVAPPRATPLPPPSTAQPGPQAGNAPTELPPRPHSAPRATAAAADANSLDGLVARYNQAQEDAPLGYPNIKFHGSDEHFRFNVVPLEELTTSNQTGYKPYGALQPRKGGEGGIDLARIHKISANFEAARVANTNADLGTGSPIEIEGVVIGGNNRVSALRLLSPAKRAEYDAEIDKLAEPLGLGPVIRGIRESGQTPVFVRSIEEPDGITTARLIQLAEDTNASPVATYTPSASATIRATKLAQQLADNNNPRDRNSIEGAYQSTLDEVEKPRFVNPKGELTPDGHRNLDDALFALAIGSLDEKNPIAESVINAAAASKQSDIKAIYDAVVDSGGDLSYLQNRIEGGGGIDPKFGLQSSLANVISAIDEARKGTSRNKIADKYNSERTRATSDGGLDTNDAGRNWDVEDALWHLFYRFSEPLTDSADFDLKAGGIPTRARGGAKVSTALKSYIDEVDGQNTPLAPQADAEPRALLRQAIEKADGGAKADEPKPQAGFDLGDDPGNPP